MDEKKLKRTKILYELYDYIDDLKVNDDEIKKFTDDINLFIKPRDSFEEQNDKVFNINLYILIRLYKKEYIFILINKCFIIFTYHAESVTSFDVAGVGT